MAAVQAAVGPKLGVYIAISDFELNVTSFLSNLTTEERITILEADLALQRKNLEFAKRADRRNLTEVLNLKGIID